MFVRKKKVKTIKILILIDLCFICGIMVANGTRIAEVALQPTVVFYCNIQNYALRSNPPCDNIAINAMRCYQHVSACHQK